MKVSWFKRLYFEDPAWKVPLLNKPFRIYAHTGINIFLSLKKKSTLHFGSAYSIRLSQLTLNINLTLRVLSTTIISVHSKVFTDNNKCLKMDEYYISY